MARILEEKRGVCEELRHDNDTGSGGSSAKRDPDAAPAPATINRSPRRVTLDLGSFRGGDVPLCRDKERVVTEARRT